MEKKRRRLRRFVSKGRGGGKLLIRLQKPGAKDKGKETGKKEKIIESATKKRATGDAEKGKEQLANISSTVAKLIKGNTPVTEAVELLDKFVKGRPADELTLEAQLKMLSYVYDEFQ